MLLDTMLTEAMKNFDTHHNIPDTSKVCGISKNLSILTPNISILAAYIDGVAQEEASGVNAGINDTFVNSLPKTKVVYNKE